MTVIVEILLSKISILNLVGGTPRVIIPQSKGKRNNKLIEHRVRDSNPWRWWYVSAFTTTSTLRPINHLSATNMTWSGNGFRLTSLCFCCYIRAGNSACSFVSSTVACKRSTSLWLRTIWRKKNWRTTEEEKIARSNARKQTINWTLIRTAESGIRTAWRSAKAAVFSLSIPRIDRRRVLSQLQTLCTMKYYAIHSICSTLLDLFFLINKIACLCFCCYISCRKLGLELLFLCFLNRCIQIVAFVSLRTYGDRKTGKQEQKILVAARENKR